MKIFAGSIFFLSEPPDVAGVTDVTDIAEVLSDIWPR